MFQAGYRTSQLYQTRSRIIENESNNCDDDYMMIIIMIIWGCYYVRIWLLVVLIFGFAKLNEMGSHKLHSRVFPHYFLSKYHSIILSFHLKPPAIYCNDRILLFVVISFCICSFFNLNLWEWPAHQPWRNGFLTCWSTTTTTLSTTTFPCCCYGNLLLLLLSSLFFFFTIFIHNRDYVAL